MVPAFLRLILPLLLCVVSFAQLSQAARVQKGYAKKKDGSKMSDIVVGSWQEDRVEAVPGFAGNLPTRHYAGYIPVGEGGKRRKCAGRRACGSAWHLERKFWHLSPCMSPCTCMLHTTRHARWLVSTAPVCFAPVPWHALRNVLMLAPAITTT